MFTLCVGLTRYCSNLSLFIPLELIKACLLLKIYKKYLYTQFYFLVVFGNGRWMLDRNFVRCSSSRGRVVISALAKIKIHHLMISMNSVYNARQ